MDAWASADRDHIETLIQLPDIFRLPIDHSWLVRAKRLSDKIRPVVKTLTKRQHDFIELMIESGYDGPRNTENILQEGGLIEDRGYNFSNPQEKFPLLAPLEDEIVEEFFDLAEARVGVPDLPGEC